MSSGVCPMAEAVGKETLPFPLSRRFLKGQSSVGGYLWPECLTWAPQHSPPGSSASSFLTSGTAIANRLESGRLHPWLSLLHY